MGKWTSDAAKETNTSSNKAAQAGHDARDHATKAGVFERGNNEKNSERFSRTDKSGSAAMGFWKSIFG